MIEEVEGPRQAKPKPLDLETLSVEELETRVEELRAEIVRIEEAIAKKKAYLDAAGGFFKS